MFCSHPKTYSSCRPWFSVNELAEKSARNLSCKHFLVEQKFWQGVGEALEKPRLCLVIPGLLRSFFGMSREEEILSISEKRGQTMLLQTGKKSGRQNYSAESHSPKACSLLYSVVPGTHCSYCIPPAWALTPT